MGSFPSIYLLKSPFVPLKSKAIKGLSANPLPSTVEDCLGNDDKRELILGLNGPGEGN